MDFGRVCVGETVHRHITLHNTGALPTSFQFVATPSAVPAIQVGIAGGVCVCGGGGGECVCVYVCVGGGGEPLQRHRQKAAGNCSVN